MRKTIFAWSGTAKSWKKIQQVERRKKELTAEEELSLEAQTIDRELEECAEAREREM